VNNNWSAPTSWDEVCKRNAGRRHYNSVRSFRRAFRRKQVADLLCRYGMIDRGVCARIARELGVHRSVITRDVQSLLTTANTARRSGPVPRDTAAR
jgi:hypothetical protein